MSKKGLPLPTLKLRVPARRRKAGWESSTPLPRISVARTSHQSV